MSNDKIIILGLCGAIGSGKTTVLNIFRESYGFKVYESDKIAHEIMNPGEDVYYKIVKEFGTEILSDGVMVDDIPVDDIPTDDIPVDDIPTDDIPGDDIPGDDIQGDNIPTDDIPADDIPVDDITAVQINRKKLGNIVFNDKDKLDKLNKIVHPGVIDAIKRDIEKNKTCKRFIIESAILFESGCDRICHKTVGLCVDYDVRIKRLIESRDIDEKKIKNVLNNQLSNEELEKKCDYIIDNSGSNEDLNIKIKNMIKELESESEL